MGMEVLMRRRDGKLLNDVRWECLWGEEKGLRTQEQIGKAYPGGQTKRKPGTAYSQKGTGECPQTGRGKWWLWPEPGLTIEGMGESGTDHLGEFIRR